MTESLTPDRSFVPPGFTPPPPPRTENFWLEPLGEEHNAADYAAWTSSMEHIKETPGFAEKDWPHPMSLEENAADLRMHADHFERRVGFTYTVRSTSDDDVIGCLYIYPSETSDASVRSWVRKSHADLDADLWRTVCEWLKQWPFANVDYAPRWQRADRGGNRRVARQNNTVLLEQHGASRTTRWRRCCAG